MLSPWHWKDESWRGRRRVKAYGSEGYIRTIKDEGLELHVWTVDDLADTLEAFRRGAQTVTTNCAKKQLDEYRNAAK